MLGQIIAQLDDPTVARGLVAALDAPELTKRLASAAAAAGVAPEVHVAETLRSFIATASDDHWLQLIGIMNRAADPSLAAVRAILLKALPEIEGADPHL